MTKFQIILTGVFGVFIVIGVIVFSMARTSQSNFASVTVWGTMSEQSFSTIIDGSGIGDDKSLSVNYVRKLADSFQNDFVEALASGEAPDLIIIPLDDVLKNKDKIFALSYKNISERDFKDTFIEGAELLLQPDGVYGLPLVVDPMVLYWNRTMFSNKGLSQPPKYWSELYDLAKTFVVRSEATLSITKTSLPLGEYSNISHAKDILSMLIMQAGTPIISQDENSFRSVLSEKFNYTLVPTEAALDFYTNFSNPAKNFYSWNRALPNSQEMFVSGDTAMYLGFASEINLIQAKNPNLNFDVTTTLQNKENGKQMTYGRFYVMAIPKLSKSANGAYRLATTLSSKAGATVASNITGLPPVRRDLLAVRQEVAHKQTFFTSALWSFSWLDPDSLATKNIFKDMIENVTSGRLRVSQAVSLADGAIQALLKNLK